MVILHQIHSTYIVLKAEDKQSIIYRNCRTQVVFLIAKVVIKTYGKKIYLLREF